MLMWAFVFLLVAVTAGFVGFSGVAVGAAGLAQLLFFVAVIMFSLAMLAHLVWGAPQQS